MKRKQLCSGERRLPWISLQKLAVEWPIPLLMSAFEIGRESVRESRELKGRRWLERVEESLLLIIVNQAAVKHPSSFTSPHLLANKQRLWIKITVSMFFFSSIFVFGWYWSLVSATYSCVPWFALAAKSWYDLTFWHTPAPLGATRRLPWDAKVTVIFFSGASGMPFPHDSHCILDAVHTHATVTL